MDHKRTLLLRKWPVPEIETANTPFSLAICHQQAQSPLFALLPGEIRNLIFEYATMPYVDASAAESYKVTDFWYRPGHHGKPKHSTKLLLTCRRVWLEANSLPIQQAEPAFWFKGEDRKPLWSRQGDPVRAARVHIPHRLFITEENRFKIFMRCLTPNNLKDLVLVQFFTQMYWLERGGYQSLSLFLDQLNDVQWPPTVVFTIKHTDWWFWESNDALTMKSHWIPLLLTHRNFKGVKNFRLELETLDFPLKVKQLQSVIEQVKKEQPMIGNWHIKNGCGEEPVLKWSGPSVIGNVREHPYKRLKKLEYVVFQLIWQKGE